MRSEEHTSELQSPDSQAKDSVKALYSYLAALDKADQVLFGHQNDTHKHVTSREGVYSDTKDITGSISGLVGIDSLSLTGVESGFTDKNWQRSSCRGCNPYIICTYAKYE